MSLPNLFRIYLISKKHVSAITAKNYVSDLRKFLSWFESSFGKAFQAQDLTPDVISLFEKTKGSTLHSESLDSSSSSTRSFERYMSSLRKFSQFLLEEGYLTTNPFEKLAKEEEQAPVQDPWHIKDFKDFLYVYGASKLTIKNYIVDILSFTSWAGQLPQISQNSSNNNIELINSQLIDEYKNRLLFDLHLSPKSINRKLSSIRKYIEFAKAQNLNHKDVLVSENTQQVKQGLNLDEISSKQSSAKTSQSYSKIPPIRLFQKLLIPYLLLEEAIATKIASSITHAKLVAKAANGTRAMGSLFSTSVSNIPKAHYAPVSTAGFAFHQKIIHHARFTRPNWYKTYHRYAISHYFHFAILVVYASAVGFILYQGLFQDASNQKAQAAPASPPRILSFQGRLTDNTDNPITTATAIRFQIYDDISASGAGNLLWQEVDVVSPDQDGIFSQLLGDGASCPGQPLTPQTTACSIPASVFTDNATLYLGITIVTTPELTPRQRLATVAFAANSEALQGMLPITDVSAGQTNVVLALDSSGNLTIGGSASPTFAATGGQFKLSGQTLLLSTEASSNGNVTIAPDGLGKIDVRKPLTNTTANGNLAPGAVEINDKFAVLATESAVAAFVVNNNTTGGDIFAASSSGTPRFVLQNDGDVQFQPGGSLDTISTGTLSIGGTTATTLTIGRSGQGITLPGFTSQNGVLYGTNGTGVLAQATTASTGLCLLSGAANPSWTTCPGGAQTTDAFWNQTSGLLYPNNSTVDFAVGGQATTSAKFAVLNVNSGTPVASISGNFIAYPNNGAGGNLGIGTTNPTNRIHVVNPSTGTTVFTVDASGNVVVGNAGGGKLTAAIVDPYLVQNQYTSGNTQLTFQTMAASNGDFLFQNQSTELATLFQAGLLHLEINGSAAGLQIGDDTQLFRGSTNRLDLATGDSFNIVSGSLAFGGTTVIDSSRNGTFQNVNVTGTCTGCVSSIIAPFQELTGAIVPNNSTLDFLIGGQASTSAKFAVLNVNSGTPTASVSAGTAGGAFLTATGNLSTTARQAITIGNSSTFNTSGNTLINPNGTGSVGIGTADPAYTLDVSGRGRFTAGATASSAIGSLQLGTTGAAGGIVFHRSSDGSGQGFIGYPTAGESGEISLRGNGGSGLLTFYTGGSERMRIVNGGSVGIGTTGPDSQLDVLSPAGGTQLRLTSTDGTVYADLKTDQIGDLTITPSGGDASISGTLKVSSYGAFGSEGTVNAPERLLTAYQSYTGTSTAYGTYSLRYQTGGSNAGSVIGSYSQGNSFNLGVGNTLNQAIGFYGQAGNSGGANPGTVTSAMAFYASNSTLSAGTLTNGYGLYIADQTSATNDYGIAITGADTQVLWLGSGADNTDAANGIAFGSSRDTNLYRSAADTLKTDDAFNVNGNLNITSAGAISAATGITSSGNITFSTFSTNGGLLYTNGSGLLSQITSQGTAGTDCLVSAGAGSAPTFSSCAGSVASQIFWNQSSGALYPKNSTVDLLVGGQSTASAKFAVLNMNSGTPVATISANSGNIATYLTGDGTLSTTNRQSLTIGNSSTYNTTGNVLINSNGQGRVGIGTTNPQALLNPLATTEQLRLSYDASNYSSFTTSSGGDLTVAPSGGDTNITGTLDVSGHGAFGSAASVSTAQILTLAGTITDIASARGLVVTPTLSIGSDYNTAAFGINNTMTISGTANQTSPSRLFALENLLNFTSTGTSVSLGGIENVISLGASAGSSTIIRGLYTRIDNNSSNAITDAIGIDLANPSTSGPITNLYGLYVRALSDGGTNNVGVRIDEPSGATNNFSLYLSGTSGAAASGIQFGTDTNLYRSAANTLKTDDAFNVNGNLNITSAGAISAATGITSSGNITFSTFSTNGGLLYTNGSGLLSQITSQGTASTDCLVSAGAGAAPTFSSCAGGVASSIFWNQSSGALYPKNSTVDLLVGGQSTASAKFAVLNVNSGTTTATVAGNLIVMPADGAGGKIGIGNINPIHFVDARRDQNASTFVSVTNGTSGTSALAGLVATNNGSSNTIFGTASTAYTGITLLQNRGFITASGTTAGIAINAEGADPIVFGISNNEKARFDTVGNFGLGTTTPIAQLHVTRPLTFGANGKALAVFDQIEDQDILTASSGGITKFVLTNGGSINLVGGQTSDIDTLTNTTLKIGATTATTITLGRSGQGITLPGFTTNGGVFYANGSGALTQTGVGTSTQCLLGGTTPTFGSCGTGISTDVYWSQSSGALYPNNSTVDLLVGGQATTSARFAITGVNDGTPVATLSASTNNNGLVLNAASSNISSLRGNTLTLGGTTTGLINILNKTGTGFSSFDTVNSRFGVGTLAPDTLLSVFQSTGTAADLVHLRDTTDAEDLVIRYDGSANYIFNSELSAGGFNWLTLNSAGNVGVGTTGPDSQLDVLSPGGGTQLRLTSTDGTVYTTFKTDQIGDLTIVPSGGDASISATLDVSGHSAFGPSASISTTDIMQMVEAFSGTSGTNYGINSFVSNNPGSSSTTTIYGVEGQGALQGAQNNTNLIAGLLGNISHQGTGTASNMSSIETGMNLSSTGTIASARGLRVNNPSLGAGPGVITTNYGILVVDQTAGVSDYGIAIAGADTQALWVGSGADNTDAANGIAFGSSLDTNLYRSAADTLKTDDAFNVNGNLNITSAGAISAATGITSSGTITFSAFTTAGGILYTNGSGVLAQTTAGSSSECLKSAGGGTPTWGSCGSGSSGPFQELLGAIVPNNSTLDFLIGGQATTSAKFAVLNVNGSGPATASVSGNLTVFPTNGAGGNVGIGTTTPGARLDVAGNILLNGGGSIDTRAAGTLAIGGTTQTGLQLGRTGQSTQVMNLTTNGVVYVSNANGTLNSEAQLATSRGGLGANVTAAGAGEILYSTGTTTYGHLAAGSSGQCLLSGGTGAPVWSPCQGGIDAFWNQGSGALYPNNSTVDLLVGSQATTSAKFAVLNVNGSGPATATVSGNLIVMPTNGAGGNVGIGTISPAARLDISAQTVTGLRLTNSNQTAYSLVINNATFGTTNATGFTFNQTNAGGGVIGNNNVESIKLLNGNVGVGPSVSDPSYPLDVTGRARTTGTSGIVGAIGGNDYALSLQNNASATWLEILNNGGTGKGAFFGMTGNNFEQWNYQGGDTIFYTNPSASAGTERLRIAANGNVGIGADTTPDGLFSVGSTSQFQVNSSGAITNSTGLTLNSGAITLGGVTGSGLCINGGATASWGSCGSGGANFWQVNSGVLAPGNLTLDFAIGGTATTSAKFAVLNVNGTGPVTATVSGNLIVMPTDGAGGRVGIGNTSPGQMLSVGLAGGVGTIGTSTYYDIDNTSYYLDPAATGNALVLAGNATFSTGKWIGLGASGGRIEFDDQTIDEVSFLNSKVGIGTDGAPFNGSLTAKLQVLSDLGTTPVASFAAVSTGTAGPTLWLSNDKSSGYAEVLTASSSGTMFFRLAMDTSTKRALLVAPAGSKITGFDIQDPLYKIGSKYYSTYTPSMIGLNEEMVGRANIGYDPTSGTYRKVLDFNAFPEDSDLWLFARVTDPNINLVNVLLTANSQARTWYKKDPVTRKITFYSDRPTEVTFRLSAPRYDHANAPTISDSREDASGAHEVSGDLPLLGEGQADSQDNFLTNLSITTYSGVYGLVDTLGNAVVRVDAFSKLIVANITAGLINTQKLTTNSLTITADSVDIAGQSLQSYIVSVINNAIQNGQVEVGNSNGEEIVSPLASIDEINTNTISPLAGDEIELAGNIKTKNIKADNLKIEANATISGNLDVSNASISGDLAAGNVSTNNLEVNGSISGSNATIAGTLTADKIVANTIEGLDARIQNIVSQSADISTLSAQQLSSYYAQLANAAIASASGDFIAGLQNGEINTQYLDIENFSSDFATFREGLVALGPATFGQATFIDGISVGTTLVIGTNSIDTLGQNLEIQPLKQGAVSFMAGAVRIETDGTLVVNGNARFAGNVKVEGDLQTGVISPLGDQPIKISTGSGLLGEVALNVEGAASIAGSLTSNKLNLSLAKPAYATSPTEAVATGSAGTAVLKQNRTELTIKTPLVGEDSLIYITPVGNTNNQVLYLLRQVADQSFTVGVGTPALADIKFNWIIVN